MSQKQLPLLNTPARKFFIRQLLGCSLQHNGGIIHPNLYGKEIITQVWVQGVVVLVSPDRNDLVLDDGTGVIYVTGFTKIVKDLYLHKGMYVMVAGQLKVMGSPKKQQSPCVKVLKIADLSSNPHSEALWMAEVIHIQSHFKDQQNV
ncbi:recQ-mediated genome instability protein 2-like isoform X1 [Acropora palmata]|uniref:recQ-mediated genome instability protein 2-like isoform X1 n=1 Tax=Acropora palmata TaxID=6131 RepID=UPI003DA07F9F